MTAYTKGIREGWPECDIYRWIVSGLPRGFHILPAEEQRAALAERVPLTDTKWDALLAGMVEHVAWLHGHEVPAWVGFCVLLYGCAMVALATHAESGELFVWGSLFLVVTGAFVQSLRWMRKARRVEAAAGEELIGAAVVCHGVGARRSAPVRVGAVASSDGRGVGPYGPFVTTSLALQVVVDPD